MFQNSGLFIHFLFKNYDFMCQFYEDLLHWHALSGTVVTVEVHMKQTQQYFSSGLWLPLAIYFSFFWGLSPRIFLLLWSFSLSFILKQKIQIYNYLCNLQFFGFFAMNNILKFIKSKLQINLKYVFHYCLKLLCSI